MNDDSNNLISYELIKQAVNGNLEVMEQIKEHYRPYYSKLSLRQLKDEFGNKQWVVDELLRGRLENSLLKMILNFEMREKKNK